MWPNLQFSEDLAKFTEKSLILTLANVILICFHLTAILPGVDIDTENGWYQYNNIFVKELRRLEKNN